MASAPSDVTLTITDDEAAPTVALLLSPASISEASGVSTITATLSHKSSESDDDHRALGAWCLHGGGDGFDDCHRGRANGERAGYSDHHSSGQHDSCA